MSNRRENNLHWNKLGLNHNYLKAKKGTKETKRDGKPKILVAKYNGRCIRCQTWMPKGTKIAHYGKGMGVLRVSAGGIARVGQRAGSP